MANHKSVFKCITGVAILLLVVLPVKSRAQGTSSGESLSYIKNYCRRLLLSDTAYATEQSYRLTDDVKYDTDGPGYYQRMNAAGGWDDIDYHSQLRSPWSPSAHFYRLLLIYRSYNKNHNAAYLVAIHRSVKYWIQLDPQCTNWWQNQINTPFTFSSLMIMMGKEALPEELAYMDNVLQKRVLIKGATGQNLIWQLDNQARLALLNNDATALAACIAQMQQVVNVSAKEGIQPDYSFQQHGVMLQFGNYGMHFINTLLFWMTVTANTPQAFSADKQQILFNYCSQGLRWTVFKGQMDIPAIGRQLRENCDTKRGQTLYDNFNLLQSFDKQDACKYVMDGFTYPGKPCTLAGNKSFWRSAYMVQLAQNQYMMSVKMHGSLVKRIESINSENLLGTFMNDGLALVQQSGREYHNIEPLWNWAMLPGTTGDMTTDVTSKEVTSTSNVSGFVGQASNGQEGISAMVYNRLGIKGNKSYFMVDGMMVCLGSGITSANLANLVTTVNQSFYNGKQYQQGKNSAGEQWLWHDSIAYVFPDKGATIKTMVGNHKGNWYNIDKGSVDAPLSGAILTTYIAQSKNDSYAYIIKPAVNLNDAKTLAEKNPVKVISNTATAQAVQTKGKTLAVFYAPGSIALSKSEALKTDLPCLLICEKGKLWVADPTQKLTEVNITINSHVYKITLPAGDSAGSTVVLNY